MLEGGGKTPILNPLELEELGFKLVAYPLSLIGVSIRAMQVRFLHCFSTVHKVLMQKVKSCTVVGLYHFVDFEKDNSYAFRS